jgi:hypothetical protein
MTKHLPECWATYPCDPPAWCICDELSACEERVADEVLGALREGSQYKSGFEGGLDAAREAVAALSIDKSVWVLRHEALAAIDALREKT